MIRHFAVSMLLTSAAFSQVQLSGLRSGFVVDEAERVVRPIVGMPGSAYLGAPMNLPFGAASVTPVAGGGSLIVTNSGNEPDAWLVRNLEDYEPETIRLGPADRVWTAARATSALLYSERENVVRLAYGLDKTPATGPLVSEATLGGKPSAGAIDEETGCAYVAVRETETRIVTLCPDRPSEARTARTLGEIEVTAMVYWRRTGLVWAERAASRVSLARAPVATGSVSVIAAEADGIADPAGILPVPGQRLAIVLSGPARLVLADPARKTPPQSADLPVTPTRLDVLIPDRILCVSLDPLVVLDVEQDLAAYFVPPSGARP